MTRWDSYHENTLKFDSDICINCGRCTEVCPHRVFEAGERTALLQRVKACMECGACKRNCPVSAIQIESGVGCAYAMIKGALTGNESCGCGGEEGSSGCCE